MNIKFTGKQENGKNHGEQKETVQVRNLIGFDERTGQFHELACVRWYMSRSSNASRVYCSIWVMTKTFGEYTAGTAHTDGYGFCKQSDAFERALNSAGIYSGEPISGRGMSAVDDFLEAMAKMAGFNHAYIAKG